MFRNVCILLLSLFILISCDNNSTSVDNSKYGKIIGSVITVDGVPISSVEIRTTPPTEIKVTNSDGYFELLSLPENDYVIYAKKSGYKSKSVIVNVIKGKSTEAVIIMDEQTSNNLPPNEPLLIQPANNSSISNQVVTFKWNCNDPEGDNLNYTLYIGENITNLNVFKENITNQEVQINTFEPNKKYFWRIVANDLYGNISLSEIWNFTTTEADNKSFLVLQLKFNSDVMDMSEYNQIATQSKVNYVTDRFGNENSAAYFNGNSYIEVPNPKSMDFSEPFTIAAWIRPDEGYGNPYDNEVDIISRYGAEVENTSSFALSIKSGFLKSEIYNYNLGRTILSTNYYLTPNIWKFISFVYDGSKLKLFVNGQLVGEVHTKRPDNSKLSLLIGKRSTQNRFYSGAIDDLNIYKKALSDDEIANLYQ